MDVCGGSSLPGRDLVWSLLSHVRPALEDQGEWDHVHSLVERVVEGGTGGTRQRRAYERAGRLEDVVDLVMKETAEGLC